MLYAQGVTRRRDPSRTPPNISNIMGKLVLVRFFLLCSNVTSSKLYLGFSGQPEELIFLGGFGQGTVETTIKVEHRLKTIEI